ncbi:hypothetical protein JCM8097_004963 [Rhodosporidiobolus ruineniae]
MRFQLLHASGTPRSSSAALRRSLSTSSSPSSALRDLLIWHSKRQGRKVEVHISSPERGSEKWRAAKGNAFIAMGEKTTKKK